jgi:hypothetical protein
MPKKERLAKRAEHQAEQEERKRQQDEQKEAERWQTGAKGKSKKDTDMDKKAGKSLA